MVNTFMELETHEVELFLSLDNNFPPVYHVGLVLNLDGVAGKSPRRRCYELVRWSNVVIDGLFVFLERRKF